MIDYQKLLANQRAWIRQCGEDLAGYVAHYGAASDPEHYGNGGEAIYAADMAEMERLTQLAYRTTRTKPTRDNPPAVHGVRLGIVRTRLSDGSHVFDLEIRQAKNVVRLSCTDQESAYKLQLVLSAAIDGETSERVTCEPDQEAQH